MHVAQKKTNKKKYTLDNSLQIELFSNLIVQKVSVIATLAMFQMTHLEKYVLSTVTALTCVQWTSQRFYSSFQKRKPI